MERLVEKSQRTPGKTIATITAIVFLLIGCPLRDGTLPIKDGAPEEVDWERAYRECAEKRSECEQDLGRCMDLGEELRNYVSFK